MPTSTTKSPALNRRALLALAGAAGAAISTTAAMPAMAAGDDSLLLAMIAEEKRLTRIGEDYDRRLRDHWQDRPAEEQVAFFHMIEENRLPEPAAVLYRESVRWLDAANELGFWIEATAPRTIAGAIALIEWKDEDSPVLANVMAFLRALPVGGAA